MIARTSLFALLVAVTALPACGGDDDVDCSYDESCGGDPTGDWEVVGACTPPQQSPLDGCPEGLLTQSESVVGEWSFEADMTYSFELETVSVTQVRAPLSCVQQQEPDLATCEEASGDGLVCTTQADVCECRLVSTESSALSGTWSVSASTLTLADDFGTPNSTYDFCREDEQTLKLVTTSFDDEPTVIVLER